MNEKQETIGGLFKGEAKEKIQKGILKLKPQIPTPPSKTPLKEEMIDLEVDAKIGAKVGDKGVEIGFEARGKGTVSWLSLRTLFTLLPHFTKKKDTDSG